MKVFITGVSGVGKSTLCTHLTQLGYNAFDMDDIPNLCKLYHQDRTPVSPEEDCAELDMLKTDFLCNTALLSEHVSSQQDLTFYLGYADNFAMVAPYFEKIFLLTVSSEENRRRMSVRTTTNFAKNEKTQNELLSYKDEWENMVRTHNPIIVDASVDTATIAENILREVL